MILPRIGSRVQPATNATRGLVPHDDDSSPARARVRGDGGPSTSFLLGLGAIGGIGLLGGIAMRAGGMGKLGLGVAALGTAVLGTSIVHAIMRPKPAPIPGDEGRPGGDVLTYPSTLQEFPVRGDRTNPAPAGYAPRSGSRDAREGVVLISHAGGTGSGWVVRSGTVVTNYHVAHGHPQVSVVDHVGRDHEGVVRKLDRAHDLAIVDVPTLRDRPLPLDDAVDRDEQAETTGYPDGEFRNDRASARGMVTVEDDGRERAAIMLSGTSAEGVSGGAVINGAGEVIGTSFAVGELGENEDAEPFVLAIPNDQVTRFLNALTPTAAR